MRNNDNNKCNILSNSPQYKLPKIKFNEEWPGAKPLKFRSSIKIVPSISKSQEHIFIPHKIQSKPPSSFEQTYKPSIKVIIPPFSQSTSSISSKKLIIPKYSQLPEYQHINLSPIIQPKSHRESSKRIVNKSEHLLHSEEFTIEDIMTRKKKLQHKLSGFYIPKLNVEYAKGFFDNGEIVPGSSNRINLRKNASILKQTLYDTIDITQTLLDNKKIWKYKSMNDIKEKDNSYVCNLEKIEKDILQHINQVSLIKSNEDKGKERTKLRKSGKK